MTYRAVIFDLDGTLLDTLDDLAEATNHVLARRGMARITPAACRGMIGNGARMLLHRATGAEGEDLDGALDLFLAYYHQHKLDYTRPYDGIEKTLDALQAKGLGLAVLSNKPHAATTELVSVLLPDRPFVAVLGQRENVPIKPDPTAALIIAEQLKLPPSDVVFVGDSGVDMATAKAAGMLAVGVTWGLRDEPDLHEHGVDVVIHHPSELLDVL